MGSRTDGGPATVDELLEHYRTMAALHETSRRNAEAEMDRTDPTTNAWGRLASLSDAARTMAMTYRYAADELSKVLALSQPILEGGG